MPTPNHKPEWKVADEIGVSVRTLRRLRAAGKVTYLRVGGRILYRPQDIRSIWTAFVMSGTRVRGTAKRNAKATARATATGGNRADVSR